MKTHHSDTKNIFYLFPDFKKAFNVLQNYINILKREEHNNILHDNINESHLHREGLHLNVKGTIALAENFISRIQRFWCNAISNRELKQNNNNILLTSSFKHSINANWNLSLSSSNNDCKESVRSILKFPWSNHPQKIVLGHISINSIRYNFDIIKPMLTEVGYINDFWNQIKLDHSFSEAQLYTNGFKTPFRLDRNKRGGGILLYV